MGHVYWQTILIVGSVGFKYDSKLICTNDLIGVRSYNHNRTIKPDTFEQN